jgi:hypothetical protein
MWTRDNFSPASVISLTVDSFGGSQSNVHFVSCGSYLHGMLVGVKMLRKARACCAVGEMKGVGFLATFLSQSSNRLLMIQALRSKCLALL